MLAEGRALWWPIAGRVRPQRALQRADPGSRSPPSAACSTRTRCGAGPSAASPLKLWVNWDADGDDIANPSGEWVKIRNLDPGQPRAARRLVPARLRAAALHVPGGRRDPARRDDHGRRRRATATASTSSPGACAIPCSRTRANDARAMGDGAYLFDPLGNIRATMVYPCRVACTDPLQGALGIARRPRGPARARRRHEPQRGPARPRRLRAQERAAELPLRAGLRDPAGRDAADPDDRAARGRRAARPKAWGFAKPILRNAGDVVALKTYTDITLACTAWGDRSC